MKGQCEMELRSETGCAVEPETATVHLEDLTSDGQPQTIADKEAAVEVGRHPRPVVFHRNLDEVSIHLGDDRNLGARGRIPDRIAEENVQDLRNQAPVALNRRR